MRKKKKKTEGNFLIQVIKKTLSCNLRPIEIMCYTYEECRCQKDTKFPYSTNFRQPHEALFFFFTHRHHMSESGSNINDYSRNQDVTNG